jgi:hypothetical protein
LAGGDLRLFYRLAGDDGHRRWCALFQAVIPLEVPGRVFGLLISLTQATSPLGLLVAGPAAQAYGIPFWFVLTGIVFAVIGAVGLLIPDIIHIEEQARSGSQRWKKHRSKNHI